MIYPHMKEEKAVPIWAALGAPLIGVPLMVALLALAAPARPDAAVDPDAGVRIEQVEGQTVEQMIDAGGDCEVPRLKRG